MITLDLGASPGDPVWLASASATSAIRRESAVLPRCHFPKLEKSGKLDRLAPLFPGGAFYIRFSLFSLFFLFLYNPLYLFYFSLYI